MESMDRKVASTCTATSRVAKCLLPVEEMGKVSR